MARSIFYNVASVSVNVDGTPGNDFADEFAYRVTTPDDNANLTVGLDKASMSIASDKTCELELAYKPTSTTNDQFMQLRKNQLNGQARLIDIVINTGLNEYLTFNGCALSSVEGIEGGSKEQVMRTYKIKVTEFISDSSLF